MYSICECCNHKIDISCGSANCRAKHVYEACDILKHIKVTKRGLNCELPHWYWNAKKKSFTSTNTNLKVFVSDILKEVNDTV